MMTDETIVNRVRGGDKEAFALLVQRYRNAVYGLAYHHLQSAEDARDAAQDALVQSFLRLDQLHDPAKFAPWLRQVTVNVCHASRRQRTLDELPETLAAPANVASRIETRVVLEAALTCLSPQTRLTLTLFYIQEHSLAEIAAFFDVPVTTIKSRLRDARARLRKELMPMMQESLTPEPLPADFTTRVMRRLYGAGAVRAVAFSSDGKLLANNVECENEHGEQWGEIQVRDVAAGTLVRTIRVERIGRAILWTPDSRCVGRGCAWKTDDERWKSDFRFWNAATGEVAAHYEVADGETMSGLAQSAAFSPDGTRLATGSMLSTGDLQTRRGEVRLWEVETGRLLRTLRHLDAVWAVAFSPDGKVLASSSGIGLNQPGKNGWIGGDVRLWDADTGELLQTLERPNAAHQCSLAFSPDGSLLATGDGPDGDVLVWDTRTGEARRLQGHERSVYAAAFSPKGTLLATGSRDRTVRLWDAGTGTLKATLPGHDSTVQGITFTADGKTLASADLGPDYPGDAPRNKGSVHLWRLE